MSDKEIISAYRTIVKIQGETIDSLTAIVKAQEKVILEKMGVLKPKTYTVENKYRKKMDFPK